MTPTARQLTNEFLLDQYTASQRMQQFQQLERHDMVTEGWLCVLGLLVTAILLAVWL